MIDDRLIVILVDLYSLFFSMDYDLDVMNDNHRDLYHHHLFDHFSMMMMMMLVVN
jgi:hypothetical protein